MNKLQHWWEFQKPMQLVGEKSLTASSSYDKNESTEIRKKNSDQTFHPNVIKRNKNELKVIMVQSNILNCPS